jgi:DNA primase
MRVVGGHGPQRRRLVSGANKERSLSVGATAEVKSKLSVVDVVGESVTLKKAGTTYKGLCPFHGEKTPSFVVTPMRETWHCFGCGRGGDIFSFVMERDSLTFPEALRVLAGEAGVEIDEDARRARLRSVLDTAIAFYHAVLTNSKAGESALAYLKGRGFTDQTIETFQLGWAPAGWDHMARQLQAKRDVRPEELIEVGLASPSQRGRGPIDKFRARVLFPIRDANGYAVGLGGRLLEGEGPKYLNSPATPLFDKSRTLYLIDRAKGPIRRTEQAVIVEGYTDALMAHQAGFDNVVASLGTALTPNQIGLLTRYAKRIALAYDVDPAGEKAGTLGVTALTGLIGQLQGDDSGVKLEDVRVVRLPGGNDPDEVIRETPGEWEGGVAKAKPLVEYLIGHHAARYDLKQSTGRIGFVEAVISAVRDIADPLRRDEALQEVRRVSGVDERVLRQVLDRRMAAGGTERNARFTLDSIVTAPDALPVGDILQAVTPVEAELLRLLLVLPDEQLRVADALGPDQLPSTLARELYRAIVLARAPDDHGVHPPFGDVTTFVTRLPDDEVRALAQAVLAVRKPAPEAREVGRLLVDIEGARLRDRIDYLESALLESERDGDADSIARLQLELKLANETRRSIDRRREDTRLLARPAVGAHT